MPARGVHRRAMFGVAALLGGAVAGIVPAATAAGAAATTPAGALSGPGAGGGAGAPTWTTRATLSVSGEDLLLAAISATGGGDVWAAGHTYDSSTGESRTLALRRHGGAWGRVDTPDVESAPAQDFLTGVDAASPTDVWLVGSSATAPGDATTRPLVEHWDGTTVRIDAAPDPGGSRPSDLSAVSGPSDDLWAVGEAARTGGGETAAILHRRGATWGIVPFRLTVPGCSPVGGSDLLAVVRLRAGSVYVGGSCTSTTSSRSTGFVARLAGSGWALATTVPAPSEITGLTGGPGGLVWAVGEQDGTGGGAPTSRGVAKHGAGTSWHDVDQPVVAGSTTSFAGVAVTASSVAAVGTAPSPQPPFVGFGAFTLGGTTWRNDPVRTPFGGFGRFYGAAADSSGHLLAAGFGISSSGVDVALIAGT